MVLSVGISIWWLVWTYQANQQLAAEIQAVRSRGEPLTTVELNDYYQPAEGRPDMTKEILAAFNACLPLKDKPQWIRLPLVGYPQDFDFPEEVPPATETWGQLVEVEAYLNKQQSSLATFHEVARQKGTARYPTDYIAGFNAVIEHVQDLRRAAQLLSLEFHVHLHRGRTSQAVDSILVQLAMAQTLEGDPSMVSQLVRSALGKLAITEMERALREATISDADVVRLQKGLRDFQFESGLKQALIGERASAYTACIDPLKMAGPKANPTPEEIREIASRSPQRVADAAKILEIHRRLIESAEQPLPHSLRTALKVKGELDVLTDSPVDMLTYTMTLLMVPGATYSAQAFAEAAARRDSANAALAAELYRRKHGKWPQDLGQLVPEFLPVVPSDPFADAPMQMRVTVDGLRVYSMGNDSEDNGGNLVDRMIPGGDIGFDVQKPLQP